MALTVAAITDLHFGPRASFQGKLRKLSDQAPALTRAFVAEMNQRVHPDAVLVLGDLIEHQSEQADAQRYAACVQELSAVHAPVHHVVGNHDSIYLPDRELCTLLGRPQLHFATGLGPYRLLVLRTIERRDRDVSLEPEQMRWLQAELAASTRPCVVAMHHSAADQDLRGNRWFEQAPHLALIDCRRQLREIIGRAGHVALVINGHLHWNHIDVYDQVPYVTVQSLTENLDDDEPGTPARAWAIVTLDGYSVQVSIEGACPVRFAHHRRQA